MSTQIDQRTTVNESKRMIFLKCQANNGNIRWFFTFYVKHKMVRDCGVWDFDVFRITRQNVAVVFPFQRQRDDRYRLHVT